MPTEPTAAAARNPVVIEARRYPSVIAMLTHADRRILDFERGWWMYPFPKECTIADVLGFDVDRYYTRLRELVDLPEADHYDPLTVRRLRALIGSR